MAVLYDNIVPVALGSGAAPEFIYLASEYSEEVQTARIEGPSVIKMQYFIDSNGSAYNSKDILLNPAKGDYIKLGGSLIQLDMADPFGTPIVGSVYTRLTPTQVSALNDGCNDIDDTTPCNKLQSVRYRGLYWLGPYTGGDEPWGASIVEPITIPRLQVKFADSGCLRGDIELGDGINCQTKDFISSHVQAWMPFLSFQSEGVVYTYDWESWSNFRIIEKPPLYRFDGYEASPSGKTLVPLNITAVHAGDHMITAGADAAGYGFTEEGRIATNGAGMYEDAAKIRLLVTEGDIAGSWLWLVLLAGVGVYAWRKV